MSTRIAVCALLLAASLKAQVATAIIVGVVQEATGAVAPNALVTTLHVATVEEFKVKTNNFSAEFGRSA